MTKYKLAGLLNSLAFALAFTLACATYQSSSLLSTFIFSIIALGNLSLVTYSGYKLGTYYRNRKKNPLYINR